jgi:hypothetical protein
MTTNDADSSKPIFYLYWKRWQSLCMSHNYLLLYSHFPFPRPLQSLNCHCHEVGDQTFDIDPEENLNLMINFYFHCCYFSAFYFCLFFYCSLLNFESLSLKSLCEHAFCYLLLKFKSNYFDFNHFFSCCLSLHL